jgi:hypothetical protein
MRRDECWSLANWLRILAKSVADSTEAGIFSRLRGFLGYGT